MEKIKEFISKIDWVYIGKIALVIVPVLIWEVFYNSIKYIAKACDKIDEVGGEFLTNFMK